MSPVMLMVALAAMASPVTSVPARFPGEEVVLVVYSETMAPLPAVAVSLFTTSDYAAFLAQPRGVEPVWRGVTGEAGRTRLALPEPGEYVLLLELSGFMRLALGPFRVCPHGQASCGPVLRNPTLVVLPFGTHLD